VCLVHDGTSNLESQIQPRPNRTQNYPMSKTQSWSSPLCCRSSC